MRGETTGFETLRTAPLYLDRVRDPRCRVGCVYHGNPLIVAPIGVRCRGRVGLLIAEKHNRTYVKQVACRIGRVTIAQSPLAFDQWEDRSSQCRIGYEGPAV